MQSRRRGMRATKGRSYVEIEKLARNLRMRMGLTPAMPLPDAVTLQKALRNLHMYTRDGLVTYDYAAAQLPPGVEGETKYDQATRQIVIALGADAELAFERNDGRARFTFAHELGHAEMHFEELLQLSTIPHTEAALLRSAAATHADYLDTEWQANAFGGALLMPATELHELEIRGRLIEKSAMIAFGVSREAAAIRLNLYQHRKKELLDA